MKKAPPVMAAGVTVPTNAKARDIDASVLASTSTLISSFPSLQGIEWLNTLNVELTVTVAVAFAARDEDCLG